ncbi:MAG: ABC transporter substrate-binding protein [Sutterella wadsworthensis]
MATDFVLMNRRTFGIRTAALCFAAGMMVSPFSLAAEEPLLKIGVLPAADSVLLYAAESEGFFESRGLRIQLLPFKSAIEIGAAMRAGELAGHYGDLINVFTQNAAGAPQAVAATVTYANPAERNFALVTRPGSNLTSLEDIKTHPGTDTAMSASTIIDYLLDRMEATTGLPPSAMKRVEVRQIPIRLQLLLAGKMETALLPEPSAAWWNRRAAEHLDDRTLAEPLAVVAFARPLSHRKRQPPSARRSPMRLRPLKAIRKSSVP